MLHIYINFYGKVDNSWSVDSWHMDDKVSCLWSDFSCYSQIPWCNTKKWKSDARYDKG